MRLIVTRPEPDAARTARALIALGHVAILSPMIDVVAVGAAFPEQPFQAVLATSGNAVRALAAHPDRARVAALPFLAVGDQTALEAKRAGFAKARSAGGAVENLVALAETELARDAGPVFYAAGDVQAGDLAGRLAARGFRVETEIVYRTEIRMQIANVAAKALRAGEVDGVLFYSRRSAAAFVQALPRSGLSTLGNSVACFCLAPACAAPLKGTAQGPIWVADKPDQINLFALIERYRRDPPAASLRPL